MAKKKENDTSPVDPGEVVNKTEPTQYDLEREANRLTDEQAEARRLADEQAVKGYFYKGKRFGIKESMPNRIKLDGVIYSKEEIMSNTDILESMVDSKNIFIKEM